MQVETFQCLLMVRTLGDIDSGIGQLKGSCLRIGLIRYFNNAIRNRKNQPRLNMEV